MDVLFGFSTDTGDVLGLVTDSKIFKLDIDNVKNSLKSFLGSKLRPYPKYSSPSLAGAKIKEKTGEIKSIKFLKSRYFNCELLHSKIKKKINLIMGDFRQEKILKCWDKKLVKRQEKFLTIRIKVRSSSGVYMRQLAEEIGQKSGVSALALNIKRTKIYL